MEKNYMDASLSPKERAELLLPLLSKEEKMAQIQNFELNYDDANRADFYTEFGIGFLSAEWMQYCETLEEAVEKQRILQTRAIEQSPHQIPACFYVHGIAGAHIVDSASFPCDINRGAGFNTRLEEKIGAITARQAIAAGVNLIISPVMDITRHFFVEKQRKTYGEARALGVIMGAAYAAGVRNVSVMDKRAGLLTTANLEWENLDDEMIDALCLEALTDKFRFGLFENPFALQEEDLRKFYHQTDDYEVARVSAEESLILLKNDGILPIKKSVKKIALIGPHANDPYSYYMNEKSVQKDTVTILDRMIAKRGKDNILYAKGYDYEGNDNFDEAFGIETITQADIAVLTIGMRYEYWNHEMGGMDIDTNCGMIPECQMNFIRKAKETGVPIVIVHLGVHPIASDEAAALSNAVIEALLPAEATADVIYDVLTGKVNPGGRIPIQVYDEGDKELRIPFGHGLSFCNFCYSELKADKTQMSSKENLEISFILRNEGPIAGNETIQLYQREDENNRKLIGIRKVFFLSGESRKVVFEVSPAQVAVPAEEGEWTVYPGKYIFDLGRSVMDIVGTIEVEITDSDIIEGPERVFYSASSVK